MALFNRNRRTYNQTQAPPPGGQQVDKNTNRPILDRMGQNRQTRQDNRQARQDWRKTLPTPNRDAWEEANPEWAEALKNRPTPILDKFRPPTDDGKKDDYRDKDKDPEAEDPDRLTPDLKDLEPEKPELPDVPTTIDPPATKPPPGDFQLPPELSGLGGEYTDYYRDLINNRDGSMATEQAYAQALEDQIRSGYENQKEQLRQGVMDFGTSRGALHGGTAQQIYGEEMNNLLQQEQRDINEMRTGLTEGGLDREIRREQQRLEGATAWAGYDTQQKGQLMQTLLGGYQADVDKWFKEGTLDMEKWNTMVEQNLGISKLELERSGLGNQFMATWMEYMIASAKTELEGDYIWEQIAVMGHNMTLDQRSAVLQNLTMLLGGGQQLMGNL